MVMCYVLFQKMICSKRKLYLYLAMQKTVLLGEIRRKVVV